MFDKKKGWYALSDEELVELYKQQLDQEFLSTVFTRHISTLFGICMKYLKNEADAKDMVQQLYEQVCKYLPNSTIKKFDAWLYTVAKNACINFLDKRKDCFIDIESVTEIEDENRGDFLEAERTYDKVNFCIEKLIGGQKTVIELFYFKKYCYREIAEKLAIDWGSVRAMIQNARRNLKICMQKQLVYDRL